MNPKQNKTNVTFENIFSKLKYKKKIINFDHRFPLRKYSYSRDSYRHRKSIKSTSYHLGEIAENKKIKQINDHITICSRSGSQYIYIFRAKRNANYGRQTDGRACCFLFSSFSIRTI